jgi:hypothetical protein
MYQLDSVTQKYSPIGPDIEGDANGMLVGWPVHMTPDGSTFFVSAIGYALNSTLKNTGQVRAYQLKTVAVPVPTKAPTTAPVKVPVPVATPSTKVPIVEPVTTSPNNNNNSTPVAPSPPSTTCGLFGLKLFCPRRGKCGFLRRLLKINGC